MSYMRKTIGIALSCILIVSFAFHVKAGIEIPNIPENWSEENMISNRETVVGINGDASAVIETVYLNREKSIAIKLRELMVGLGYDIEWNGFDRYIELNNNTNNIKIYVDSDYCEKNRMKISLNNSVFIYENESFCSQWFIENVIGVEVANVQIEEGRGIDGISILTPDLQASPRKPYPESSLLVDGKPLYIDYAENLRESLPYNTSFLFFNGINGSSEQVIIYSGASLKNFKISSVTYNDTLNIFREDQIIVPPRDIDPPTAIVLKTTIPEGIPVEVVAFTDNKGITHSYLLGYNGKDGSISASPTMLE